MPDPSSQNAWSGIGVGWSVTATMLSGLLVGGGLGYLVDLLVGTEKVFAGIGVVIGAAAAIYLVYLQFGRDDGSDDRA